MARRLVVALVAFMPLAAAAPAARAATYTIKACQADTPTDGGLR